MPQELMIQPCTTATWSIKERNQKYVGGSWRNLHFRWYGHGHRKGLSC